MRILWYSNTPWSPTGYGQQTALWVPKLKTLGHDTAVAAFHGLHGVPLNWQGITVYPGSLEDEWAQDIMLGHYHQHKADLLITLMDAWALDAQKLSLIVDSGMRTVHWLPVDCEPLSALDHRLLSSCGTRPIAISRFGERQLAEFGPLYVPHGVDTSVFRPLSDEARAAAREKTGFGANFLIGINAANKDPVRKGFGEQLAAFRLFADRHPEARMLIHTRIRTRTGGALDRLVEVLHLQGLVHFSDQYLSAIGLTSPAELSSWYSTLDVLSNCSYAEGFGIPVLEAQAAGTPVVTTDGSAMTELCGAGWLADGEWYWNAGHGAWWTRPSVQNILEAYEQAYQESGTPEGRARKAAAREFAMQYDADYVLKQYWEPVLDELEGVAGTIRYAGLRWKPDTLPHDEAAEQAVLDLVPDGGVLADTSAATGYYALQAAGKASRIIAASGDSRLAENAKLNKITNIAIQDELDIAAEPFVDVLRLQSYEIMRLRDMISLHLPALAIIDGKGKSSAYSEWLSGHGYKLQAVPGSRCILATRS